MELFSISEDKINPMNAKQKINEALSILKDLGLLREQQNERSHNFFSPIRDKTRKPMVRSKETTFVEYANDVFL